MPPRWRARGGSRSVFAAAACTFASFAAAFFASAASFFSCLAFFAAARLIFLASFAAAFLAWEDEHLRIARDAPIPRQPKPAGLG